MSSNEPVTPPAKGRVIVFNLDVNGDRATCLIAHETLHAEFDGKAGEAIQTFMLHRDEIERIVLRKIELGETNRIGGADVMPHDRDRFRVEVQTSALEPSSSDPRVELR